MKRKPKHSVSFENKGDSPKIHAVDLFCGIGGLTHGLRRAGISVKAGFDVDESCKMAYEENNDSDFICEDIVKIRSEDILKYYQSGDVSVMVGCAPCQPFSQIVSNRSESTNKKDERWGLLQSFSRLVEEVGPRIVSMENVPGLRHQKIYKRFVQNLKKAGYYVWDGVVNCVDYGIPQRRKRLLMLASVFGEIKILPPNDIETRTVRDALRLRMGGDDKAHVSYKLSAKNKKRIRQSIPGKSRDSWDPEMLLPCHEENDYPESYGRMAWDKPSPTITSQFCFYSCGRFGHPEEDRAITIREGALLQTFPPDYRLVDDSAGRADIRMLARHIGNALPPELGCVLGKSIIAHVAEQGA